MKNELGLEGDLFLEGLLAYCKIIKQKAVSSPPPLVSGAAAKSHLQYSGFLSRSNLPVVILGMAENHLTISTAVYTDALYADKLLAIDLYLGFHGPDKILRAARIFMAINKCTEELRLCIVASRLSPRYFPELRTQVQQQTRRRRRSLSSSFSPSLIP